MPAKDVAATLTRFHRAAATADFGGYFGLFHPSGSFLGTDATERWSVEEFQDYARPHFDGDRAWLFVPIEQNVTVSPDGSFAWFDERLSSESYGECRGSGVVLRTSGGWQIGQYNLTVPIPNALLRDFVARIRGESSSPTRIILVRHAEKEIDAGDDPPLTARGRRRASQLADVLRHAPLETIFATQYARTQQTARPVAARFGLDLTLVDAGDIEELARRIRTDHDGEFVLYAGHSNTVPPLLAALGVEHSISIESPDYDDVFVVTLGPTTSLLHFHVPIADR